MAAIGFSFALSEITLVLFTTLTPSGVVAAMIMVAWLSIGSLSGEDRLRIERSLYVPLLVSMIGLIASASHLGSPSNALYVLGGLGRSPLSNEVISGVLFLALLGVYWYRSHSERRRAKLEKAWRVCLLITGAAFVLFLSLAYDSESIVTWSTAYVPASVWCNAAFGGPLLALLGLGKARVLDEDARKKAGGLLVVSFVALMLNVIVYVFQQSEFGLLGNYIALASDLVPLYGISIVLFSLLGVCGIGLSSLFLVRRRSFSLTLALVGCALVFAAIFLMRFQFYMMHATSGIGL